MPIAATTIAPSTTQSDQLSTTSVTARASTTPITRTTKACIHTGKRKYSSSPLVQRTSGGVGRRFDMRVGVTRFDISPEHHNPGAENATEQGGAMIQTV